MSARPRLAIASLALVGIAGCAEEPGVELRWAIHDGGGEDEVAPLVNVQQCAEVGIERFRFDAYALPRLPSDLPSESRSFPCFPSVFGNPDAFLDGPTLAPGDYEIELIGLRRNGLEWSCGDELAPLPCARTSAELSVSASDPGRLDLVVAPPPQCDDGVDNDLDGRVDANDLGCIFDQNYEAFDFGLVVFQLSVSFLDNPLIEPKHVGINHFEIAIDGVVQPEVFHPAQSLDPHEFPAFQRRLIDEGENSDTELTSGPHTLEIVGFDAEGVEVSSTLLHDFSVDSVSTGFVQHEFEFGSTDFDSTRPLIAGWSSAPDFVGQDTSVSCQSHALSLDTVRVRVRPGEGGAAVSPITINTATQDADAEGWVTFACADAASGAAQFVTPDIAWTDAGFTLEVEALHGTTTCFSVMLDRTRPTPDPNPLAINGLAMNVTLETVVDAEGKAPIACIECTTSDDCGEKNTLVCDEEKGLCVHK